MLSFPAIRSDWTAMTDIPMLDFPDKDTKWSSWKTTWDLLTPSHPCPPPATWQQDGIVRLDECHLHLASPLLLLPRGGRWARGWRCEGWGNPVLWKTPFYMPCQDCFCFHSLKRIHNTGVVFGFWVFCLTKKDDSILLLRPGTLTTISRLGLSKDLNGVSGFEPPKASRCVIPNVCIAALEAGPKLANWETDEDFGRFCSESNEIREPTVLPDSFDLSLLKDACWDPFKEDLVPDAKCQERVLAAGVPEG